MSGRLFNITWAITWLAGWIRIGHRGIHWKSSEPLFSERYGYKVPFARVGSWRLFWLKGGQL